MLDGLSAASAPEFDVGMSPSDVEAVDREFDIPPVDLPSAGTRSLVLQYSWLLSSRLTSAVLQAVTLVLLARWVGPSAFGLAAATTGALTVVGACADFGLGPLLLRQRSRDCSYGHTGQILRTNAVTSASLAILTASAIAVLAAATSRPTLYALLPMAIWIAAEKNGDLWLNLAVSEGRTHVSAVSILLRRGLGLSLFAGLSVVMPALWAFSIGVAAGSSLANLTLRRVLEQGATDAPPSSVRQLLREAMPFYLNSVASQARNLDVLIVSMVAGPLAAGVYAVPSRMTSPLRMLPTSLSPIIVRYSALGTPSALRAVRHVSTTVMVIMPGMMIGVAIAAPRLVELSLGAAFASAVLPLRIICGGLVFAFAVSLLTSYLQGRGDEQYVGKIAVIVTVLSLASLAVGAGLASSTGAAYAVSLTFVIHSLLLAGRARRPRDQSEGPPNE